MLLPRSQPGLEPAQARESQRQHDEIFGTLERVRDHHERSSRGRLVLAYDEFLACVRAHFEAEELLIVHFEPDRLPAHRAAHDAILRRSVDLRSRLQRMDAAPVMLELQTVESWLADHCIDEGARLI